MSLSISGCAIGHGVNTTVQRDGGEPELSAAQYFTLRLQLGGEYLSLLQFILIHRTILRSRDPERVGKSPKQLMTGQAHPHWLTVLGFGIPQPLRGRPQRGQNKAPNDF
jgi:hypothetical protein